MDSLNASAAEQTAPDVLTHSELIAAVMWLASGYHEAIAPI